MKINWLSVARIGAAMVNIAVPGVQAAEVLAEKVATLHGTDKEDAVIALVRTSLLTAEGISGKDLLEDAAVEVALRDVIGAVHALHEAVAQHKAVAAAPAV